MQERTDKKLLSCLKDRQGNKNFRSSDKIYCQLNEKQIKVFCKKTYYWDVMEIYQLKVVKDSYFWRGNSEQVGGIQIGSFCCSSNN